MSVAGTATGVRISRLTPGATYGRKKQPIVVWRRPDFVRKLSVPLRAATSIGSRMETRMLHLLLPVALLALS